MQTSDMWRGLRSGMVVALVTALAACGGKAGSQFGATESPTSFLTSAVSKLQSSSGSTAKFQANLSTGSGNMSMTGVQQFTPTMAMQAHVTMSGGQASSLLGSGMDVVLENGVEYVKLGGSTPLLPRGKQWLKVDLNQASSSTGVNLGAALKVNQGTDPAQQMKLLLASGDVKRVGRETVDGADTTHYAGTVDPSKLLQSQAGNGLSSEDVKSLQSTLQTAGVTNEHIDVWLDKSGLPVEMKAATDTSAAGTVTVDDHFSDWGAPVTITAPPADQVQDMSKLGLGG